MVSKKDLDGKMEFKLYKKRWVMLAIMFLYVFNGSMQWGQYSVISNLVTKYYNVSATLVELTTTCFQLCYILFVFPDIYILDKLGIRKSMLLGSLAICIGTWLKVYAVAEDRFALLFIGQFLTAFIFTFTYGLAGRFTSLWFGANEISTAGALVLLGDHFGSVFAFFMPTIVVQQGSKEIIGYGLKTMNFLVAILCTVSFIFVLFVFKDKPRLPPSKAQAVQREVKKESVPKAVKSMFSNKSFILILLSFGLNGAPYMAVLTLLNGLISMNFPGQEDHAGRIGALMMVLGMISSFVNGLILDKTKKFKESAVLITTCSAIFFATFTWALKSDSLLLVYLSASLYGYFAIGYYATGFQIGIEVTYPVSEAISTPVAFLSTSIFGFSFMIIYGYTVKIYGDLISNIGILIVYIITVLITILIPADLKRQEVENTTSMKEIKDLIPNRQ